MIATIIRAITRHKARPLSIEEDKVGAGPLGQLKIALVTDAMTSLSLAKECRVRELTPQNYKDVLQNWKPHCVFIESAFHGKQSSWLYQTAKQPAYIRQIQPHTLEDLLQLAKDEHIPTAFWNKDDIPFYDAFLHVAKLVDYVFTADSNFIPRYTTAVPPSTQVHLLAMAYEPAFHNFTGFHFKEFSPCFLGSYYKGMLSSRQAFFKNIFEACAHSHMPLHVYDRHKHHLFHATHFSFPKHDFIHIHDPVPYTQTAAIYKHYSVCLNVNSVTDSDTMVSRRLLEILACGGIVLTNTSPTVQNYFSSYCHSVQSQEEATQLLTRWKYGPSQEDKDRAEAGAQYVLQNHTWGCRLEQLAKTIGF